MPTWVCLLRAVNLGPHNKVPMAALRKAMEAAGFHDVRTYVQSGNVVARSALQSAGEVAEVVAGLVSGQFAVDSPVVVRTGAQLSRAIARNPFPEAARERPRLLHLVFLAETPDAGHVAALQDHELARDSCRVDGDSLYVDYREGVHGSKMTPQLLARLLGVEGTARNWRTVTALDEMARA